MRIVVLFGGVTAGGICCRVLGGARLRQITGLVTGQHKELFAFDEIGHGNLAQKGELVRLFQAIQRVNLPGVPGHSAVTGHPPRRKGPPAGPFASRAPCRWTESIGSPGWSAILTKKFTAQVYPIAA